METIEASYKHLSCRIGKQNENGFVNVHTNFVPLEQLDFIRELKGCDHLVLLLSNVADYGDGTGGLAIKMETTCTEMDLGHLLVDLMKSYINIQ